MVVAISMASSTSTAVALGCRSLPYSVAFRVVRIQLNPVRSSAEASCEGAHALLAEAVGDLATCQHLVDRGRGEAWAHACPAGAVALTATATWGRALTVATKPSSSCSHDLDVLLVGSPSRRDMTAAAADASARLALEVNITRVDPVAFAGGPIPRVAIVLH